MYLLFLEWTILQTIRASVGNLPSKDSRGHLLARVMGGGGGWATLFSSHFSKLFSILSRISEMFYLLKVPFSNFCHF